MDSVNGPGSRPTKQDKASGSSEKKTAEPVTRTHKFRNVKKVAVNEPTSGLKSRKRRRKPQSRAFQQLRAKIQPATTAPQIKASELNARAVSESRVFTSEELFAAAGAQNDQENTLKVLGRMLNNYSAEVLSSNSKLASAEKVIITLKLRESARQFLAQKEHELTQPFISQAQSQQRIMATYQLLAQIELQIHQLAGNDRASYSQKCCKLLCHDIKHQGGKLLAELYRQPGVMEGVIGEMEYSDVLRFANACAGGKIEISDPAQIQALSRGVWQALQRMDSDEIKQQVDSFNFTRGNFSQEISVTGNKTYDQGREYCVVMNRLLSENQTPAELAIALHQSHVDGHLTMNMLDELVEEKANMMSRNFTSQSQADEVVAKLDRKAVATMQVAKTLPNLNPDIDNPGDVLLIGKINQFDSMLKGDKSGKDKEFQAFILCWDEIRFDAMPAYNKRHKRNALVDTDSVMSKELAKISPKFLTSLDGAKGDTDQVRELLKKNDLRKAPDELEFTMAMKMAEQSDNPLRRARLKHIAAQDCLYRYFEQRVGVETPHPPQKTESHRNRKT